MSRYNEKSKVKDVLKDEEAVGIVSKYFGKDILKNPMLFFLKGLTIDGLKKYSVKLSEADLRKAEAALSELFALE